MRIKNILPIAIPAVLVIAGVALLLSSGVLSNKDAAMTTNNSDTATAVDSGSGTESEATSNKTVADSTPAVASGSITGGTGATENSLTDSSSIELTSGEKTLSNLNIAADSTDESGVKVSDGATLTLSNCVITTSGDASSEEDSNFTGANAGVLATNGGIIKLVNCTIITTGSGANAVFATGEGSMITCENVKIETSGDSSRGLDATYQGTVEASKVTITTKGAHCASLATDRGEGTIKVDNAVLNTAGDGSPVVYSTGDITLSNAVGVAAGSEAAVIEGKNSITLDNTDLTSASKYGVMVYQSFSGDASEGVGTFTMTGGSLTALTGPLFYSTNTTAVINIDGADFTYGSGTFAQACADRWGTSGSNGAKVTITATNTDNVGKTDADDISSITVNEK